MEGFTDLLTDAFSETSVPSFPGQDLDFESLNFEKKSGAESASTDGARALNQEATGESTDLFGEDKKEVLWLPENVHKELADERSDEEELAGAGVGLIGMDKAQEEDYISSEGEPEEEDSASGDDEEEDDVEEAGDLLMSACCTDEVYIREKEDSIFAEGQPLALQGADNPQVSNKEQGGAASDVKVSYFGEVPEKGSEIIVKVDASEEEEQERGTGEQTLPSDLETKSMKIRQEQEYTTQRFKQEIKHPGGPDASFEFPTISLQNLQDLITEVDGEEHVERMKEFLGEEHQEAGESFADRPSDFFSYEYVEDGRRDYESEGKAGAWSGTSDHCLDVQQSTCLEIDTMDLTSCPRNHFDDEDRYLFSRDLEVDADQLMNQSVAGRDKDKWKTAIVECVESDGEGDSDSCSSSEADFEIKRSCEESLDLRDQQDPQHKNHLKEPPFHSGNRTFICSLGDDLMTNTRGNPADFVSRDFDMLKEDTLLSERPLTTDDADDTKTPISGVNPSPNQLINSYSVVMREETKTTSPSYQGSLDDGFFLNSETSGVTVGGQRGNNEQEEERNWEQEEERIKAFFEYYDDTDEETEKGGRQTRVQFSAEPLSRVIHYETDSDADSLSSFTDKEEDPSSADIRDELGEPCDSQQMNPGCDPQAAWDSVSQLSNTQIRTRKHRCLSVLKLMLKLVFMVLAGLLMYWLLTDQADWLSLYFHF